MTPSTWHKGNEREPRNSEEVERKSTPQVKILAWMGIETVPSQVNGVFALKEEQSGTEASLAEESVFS